MGWDGMGDKVMLGVNCEGERSLSAEGGELIEVVMSHA